MMKSLTICVVVFAHLAIGFRPPGWNRPPPPFRCESGQFLTRRDIDDIKDKLATVIFNDTVPAVVRLAFHDCVDGCDGCLNHNNPGNAGGEMLDLANQLDSLYDQNNYDQLLTRADFYILASIYGLEEGIRNANVGCQGSSCLRLPKIDFKYCRRDCPTSPRTNEFIYFPNGHFNHSQVINFFRDEFGLSPRLSTALMGAHTLGGASGASGFRGPWKENRVESRKFDNRYYVLLSDPELRWDHLDKSPVTGAPGPRWQWEGFRDNTQVSFMLNADVALLLDITTTSSGFSTCNFDSRCNDAPTADFVRSYAADGNLWLRDFVKAFEIMVNHGNEDRLVKVFGGRGPRP